MLNVPDIYFLPEYGRLYEKHEGGALESFSYRGPHGEVYFQFIRRPLDMIEGWSRCSDIVTPYGYGGPIFLQTDDKDKEETAAGFRSAFGEFCRDTGIVSAFLRFHPLLGNARDFRGAFDDVALIRKTVAIDLAKDVLYDEFDTKIRNSYRHAEKRGLSIRFDTELETMDSFVRLYYALMDRKNAVDYYFFPPAYFDELKELKGLVELVTAVKDGETVAAVLYLKYGVFLHTHLTASTTEGNSTRAVEAIMVSQALRAKGEGCLWNHLGGGYTSSADDSLLRFKMKFTRSEPHDFFIGKSVYDRSAYEALCLEANKKRPRGSDTDFFPLYRFR